MKTYWYIFAYIALIPSFIFIIWWLLFNASYYIWNYDLLKQLWIVMIIVSVILFIFFAIYRWTKSKFALYSAVNDDAFTKENFHYSIIITNNNWWRIVWNYLLLGIIIYIFSLLFWSIISILWFLWTWGNSILDLLPSWLSWSPSWFLDIDKIKVVLENYANNFSLSWEILSKTTVSMLAPNSRLLLLAGTYRGGELFQWF